MNEIMLQVIKDIGNGAQTDRSPNRRTPSHSIYCTMHTLCVCVAR